MEHEVQENHTRICFPLSGKTEEAINFMLDKTVYYMVHLPNVYMNGLRLKTGIFGKSTSGNPIVLAGNQPSQTILKACQGCMSFFVYLKQSLGDLVYKALALMK